MCAITMTDLPDHDPDPGDHDRPICADIPIGITLEAKATLDLNGFTLNVGEDTVGVYCAHLTCTVISSVAAAGVIDGGDLGYYGLISNLYDKPPIKRLVVDNVVIRDFENAGMYAANFGKSVLSRLTVSGCGGPGIIGRKMIVSDVTVNDNGLDPQQSGDGIVGENVRGDVVTTNGNRAAGLQVRKVVKILGLTATGNNVGVHARAVNLVDGQLFSANTVADIQSERRPRLKNTSCEHSNWGVCTLD
jgi:hypothetical protein